MVKNYMNFLYKKAQKYARMYDKRAKNPFLELQEGYNPLKRMYEQTFVWVVKPEEYND